MDDNLTYLGESKVRVSNPTAGSGAEVSIPPIVIKSLEILPGNDTIVWYLDRETNQIVPKKKEGE